MEVAVTPENHAQRRTSDDEQGPLMKDGTRATTERRCGVYRDVIAAAIAGLGAIAMGLVLGYSNPALLDEDLVQNVLKNDEDKISWFGSLIAIGAIVGGPIAANFVGSLGRKVTLMMCTVPMGVGWFMIIYGSEYILVFCGRILTGVATGMISLVVPLYIAEVSSSKRRGILGAGFQLLVTVGILGVYAIGMALNWNWLAVVCLAVSTLNILLVLIIPETPRWFVAQDERDGALRSLAWLLDEGENTDEACSELERNFALQPTQGISFRDALQPGIYKPMLISFGLMFFQQMSGINVVIFYSSQIFSNAGFADRPAIPMITIGAVLVVATVVSCLCMDVAGRRALLLTSGVFMTLSSTALGVYYYLAEAKGMTNLNWLSLTSVLVFVVFFSIGWGPIPWLVTSEIIPVRARGIVNGLATMINWALVFLVTKEFQHLTVAIHNYGAFWFFGGFCLAGCIFVFIFLPETKGRSLEEIHEAFSVIIID